MAPRPGTVPSWATTGGTRLEPSAPEKAAGHVAATRPPARKVNWLHGIFADWIAYFATVIDSFDEHTYPVAKSRSVGYSLRDSAPNSNADGTNPTWVCSIAPETDVFWKSRGNFGRLVLPLNAYLRNGMVLQDIRALIHPGAARTAGANRMSIALYRGVPDWVTPGNNPVPPQLIGGVIAYDTGTASKQLISCAFGVHTVLRESSTASCDYFLVIGGGDDAGVNFDHVHGVQLVFDDQGPRNA